MTNEIIVKMIKTCKNKSGSLSHYGHFIHDFIVPLIHHMTIKNKKYDHIYLEIHAHWCNLQNFLSKGEKILGLKITRLSTNEINLLSCPKVIIPTLSFGPYRPIFFKNIIPYVKNTLNITDSPYKIILIERGVGVHDSGASRRYLNNHNDLKNKLRRRFGSLFKNVILENISIDEQASLFMNADIVIGQHGAGLCNIIWMTKPNSLVIEFPPYQVETFKHMCIAKRIKYARIDPIPASVIKVCLEKMRHLFNKTINNREIVENIVPQLNEFITNRGVINKCSCGLGNRMFMLATGYALAKYNNLIFYLDNHQPNKHSTHNYNQTIFKYIGMPTTINNICDKLINNNYTLINTKMNHFTAPPKIINNNGIILKGFYQNYEYFKEYKIEISDLFLKGLEPNISNMSIKYDTINTGFLHIRRGDYLLEKNKRIFKQADINYYTNCVNKLKELNTNLNKIYIFTNDIPFVKSKEYFNNSIFELIEEPDELNTLALMSLCDAGAIITNSTFGWWGAFLGAYKINNPVFVFDNWMVNKKTPKLCPSEWIRV